MEYEAVIGLETHIQLSTASKMFCSCSARFQDVEPNTLVCPVCLALPGALPTVNRNAVESAIQIGLALNCEVASETKFDRKNYIYPDLMKGYQISQYDIPICYGGWLELDCSPPFVIRIERVHMEEDVAKLIHVGTGKTASSLLDMNRSGLPLMEVVTRPDFRTSEQVELYIEMLQSIVRYLGVGTANMEEGSFRCDANVSLRPVGLDVLNKKVELKNMNRVSAVGRAVRFEIERQRMIYEEGGEPRQETWGWDDAAGEPRLQRSKEEANDYRYFPEPDLPAISVLPEWLDEVKSRMPELPSVRKRRLMDDWALSDYDASVITASRFAADYFDAALAFVPASSSMEDKMPIAKNMANWFNTEMIRMFDESGSGLSFEDKVKPNNFFLLSEKFRQGEITNSGFKQVLQAMFETGKSPEELIFEMNLAKVDDVVSLEPMVVDVVSSNPKVVQDYAKGKTAAAKFLVGQVMKATRGTADAKTVLRLIEKELARKVQAQ